ncbi:MAG: hypothetical protein CO108_24340 [Deltaproteobacteria bacterium CG_4_9_14_3_um_filter_63_12]|nr:MAG: hypothetical protein CO108_24340 [Deltaproteobacteria bacterium CG_4_9_14_3_um_filter_63_12]
MTDAARENFAQAVLASLEEETGLLASPEALTLLTNVRSSGLKTGSERWMLRLTQEDLRQLFDDGVWDAWRAENLGEGGDSEGTTAANTDGLSGTQLDTYRLFVEELGLPFHDGDERAITPGVMHLIEQIHTNPYRDEILDHLRSVAPRATDLTTQNLENALNDIEVAAAATDELWKSENDDEELTQAPVNNEPVQGVFEVPKTPVFAKQGVDIRFELLSHSDVAVQPTISVEWQMKLDGAVVKSWMDQYFDANRPLQTSFEFPELGAYEVVAVVHHEHFKPAVFREQMKVLPALERATWMGMEVGEIAEMLLELSDGLVTELLMFLCVEVPEIIAALILYVFAVNQALLSALCWTIEWLYDHASEGWDLLVEGLASLTAEDLGRFISALVPLVQLPVIAALLGALLLAGQDQLVREVLAWINRDTLEYLISGATDVLYPIFLWILDEVWPQGFGVSGALGVGATVAFFDGDVDEYAHALRTSETELTYLCTRTGSVGLSAGVGVETQLDKGKARGKKDTGVNAGATADAGAHVKATELHEFVFPVLTNPSAFVGFLVELVGLTEVVNAGSALFTSLAELNPTQWQTRQKLELGGELTGSATAGVRATTGGSQKEAKWDQTEGRGDLGSPSWFQRALGLNAGADVFALFGQGVGIELNHVNRTAKTADMVLYGEVNAVVEAALNAPVLGNLMRFVPNLDGGVGVRFKWQVTDIEQEPTIGAGPQVSYYFKTGDLDTFNAAATDIDFELDDPTAVTSYRAFMDSLQAARIQRRFLLGTGIGRTFNLNRVYQEKFQSRLSQEQRDFGLDISGFVELLITLPKDSVRDLFQQFMDLVQDPAEAFRSLEALLSGSVQESNTAVEEIYDILTSHLEWVKLRVDTALGASASGKVGAGAKVRGRVNASAGVVMEEDITELFEGKPRELAGLLNGEQG